MKISKVNYWVSESDMDALKRVSHALGVSQSEAIRRVIAAVAEGLESPMAKAREVLTNDRKTA